MGIFPVYSYSVLMEQDQGIGGAGSSPSLAQLTCYVTLNGLFPSLYCAFLSKTQETEQRQNDQVRKQQILLVNLPYYREALLP